MTTDDLNKYKVRTEFLTRRQNAYVSWVGTLHVDGENSWIEDFEKEFDGILDEAVVKTFELYERAFIHYIVEDFDNCASLKIVITSNHYITSI